MVASSTEKAQSLMKSGGYLRIEAEWAVRERQDLVRCATGWEREEETGVGGDTGMGRIARRESGSTLGGGATLGIGATLGSGATIGSGVTLGGGTTLGSG